VSEPVTLDVLADIACPWCLIGLRRLERALREHPPGTFAVRHRAFELQPQMPERGVPFAEFIAQRFGSVDAAGPIFARVAAEGAKDGIAFEFDATPVAPNTRLAHRAIALARDQGFEQEAVEALFLAYFTEGLDVTDFAVVVERLADAGLPDPPALALRLRAGEGEDSVAEDQSIAAQIGVSGVPLVIAGRRLALHGAQDPAAYSAFLQQAIAPE
jgi:predicted DsbA family dithiol-disulfide isomerase